jgi:hypothetical protein
MIHTRFSLIFLAISAFLPFMTSFNSPAAAQCVMIDVSNQLAMHGSHNPSDQTNNVNMNSQGPCVGGAIGTYNAQTAVSPGDVTQTRNSNSSISNGMTGVPNVPGIGGPTLMIPVETQIDLYNPALDPSFMGGMGQ